MPNDVISTEMWGMGSPENSQFVKEVREKRIAKSLARYTPAGHSGEAKRRRKEKARKRTEEFLPPTSKIYVPFSEDPTDTPPANEVQRVGNFLSIGLLKQRKKGNEERRYKKDGDMMHGILMFLDTIKIESKTWLYNLYVNEQCLNDTL
ncbi:unnamed protein product [Cuscuta europaea]|uniref:Uncharacterized protein n=1 Tax=Cuscuta europaea TaxID=41803 RepID=A0A9P0YWG0_CUSEU|nr:unnamed protein product [Cuscuta europaea]